MNCIVTMDMVKLGNWHKRLENLLVIQDQEIPT